MIQFKEPTQAMDVAPVMKVPVGAIVVGNRHRKEMGDLQALADSISVEGLLQPIGVTERMELVFGERRLRACRDILGMAVVDARVVMVSSIVSGEMAENEIRKDFTPSERVAIAEAVRTFKHGGDRHQAQEIAVDRSAAAKQAGFGNVETFRQASNVVKLGVPKLVEKMDAGEVSISAAATIAKAEPAVQIAVVALPTVEQRDAVAKLKDEQRRIRERADEQEKRTGPTAYTGFLKKNGRMPTSEEAKTLARLDYKMTPDEAGKMHSPLPPKTKEEKAAAKEKDRQRDEVWGVLQAIQYLSRNERDPAVIAAMVYNFEEHIVETHLDRATKWLAEFRREWKRREQ